MFAASACPGWKDQRQKGRHRLRGITAPLLRIGETESQYRGRSEQEKHQTKTSQKKNKKKLSLARNQFARGAVKIGCCRQSTYLAAL